MWGRGDYSYLSKRLEPAAGVLADACAVSSGQEVLDVAAGDGNFALACAREGASVIASDIAAEMVERGRARSEREGYEIEWLEADAQQLPFEDARFDCVGSVFGAMIAPDPERVAAELFRVRAPQHRGLTAWVPTASSPGFSTSAGASPRRPLRAALSNGATSRGARPSTDWRLAWSASGAPSPGSPTRPNRSRPS